MKRKWLSALLIGAGVLILAYPKLSEWYFDRQQEALVAQWQDAFEAIDSVEPTESAPADVVPAGTASPVAASVDAGETADAEAARLDENMAGMLYIDKIDLELPILRGATQKNLKKGAASIEGAGEAGQVGNFAVAGHRNLTYGRNFNRLDELEEGDTIEVDNGDERYQYVVTEKLYVEPHEVWVLDSKGDEKEITLVTCHPVKIASHRLIVKGKIVEA
ncbi:class D sortase [Paenibacillus sp.]|uniref:class D sortase n=1 Tax=Paenibacillus sp. TaxID=58172 RepID=UPI0028128825|nr:class D sortase [Paenibacillus sp.]